MQAKDLMTTPAVVVSPQTSGVKIARILLDHGISAVPVVDDRGAVLGMVSEGDLLSRRNDKDARDSQRSWWLALLAEGEQISDRFLRHLRSNELTAKELMHSPAITVSESTQETEIASILNGSKIKRVPVTRNGKIVGIVSRADIIRSLAGLWNSSANSRNKHDDHNATGTDEI